MPVSTLAILTSMLALERAGSAPSRRRVPSCSMNEPRTLVTMAWRTVKPMLLCAGSIVYSPVSPARAGFAWGAAASMTAVPVAVVAA